MEQGFAELGGTVGVDAAIVHLAFGTDDIALALWTFRWELELLFTARVLGVFDDLDDFGNDVAAALYLDGVADLEAEALDEVCVVKGGAADGGATDEDWGEFGHGRELAGAAYLHGDVADHRDARLGGELVGDGPARGAAGVAQALLRGV